MAEGSDNSGHAKVRRLGDAINRVRLAEVERADVVVELREAERARLEMLADELRSVFAEVPADNDQFIFAVTSGTQPRLWIDQTGFVGLGRDRRTYRFLKDTRLGRTIILETADLEDMADCVTHYVAERILEKERAVEGDWVIKRAAEERAGKRPLTVGALVAGAGSTSGTQRQLGWVAATFLLAGLLLGVVLVLAYAWVRVPG